MCNHRTSATLLQEKVEVFAVSAERYHNNDDIKSKINIVKNYITGEYTETNVHCSCA